MKKRTRLSNRAVTVLMTGTLLLSQMGLNTGMWNNRVSAAQSGNRAMISQQTTEENHKFRIQATKLVSETIGGQTYTITDDGVMNISGNFSEDSLPEHLSGSLYWPDYVSMEFLEKMDSVKKVVIASDASNLDFCFEMVSTEGIIGLEEYDVSSLNANYKSVDGVLFTKDGKILKQYPINKKNTSYTIPEGTESIENLRCHNIQSIVLADSVKRLEENALYNDNKLTSLSISSTSSLTYIGDACLSNTSIEHLFIPKEVTDLSLSFLYGNQGLQEITVDSDNKNYYSQDGVLYGSETTIHYGEIIENKLLMVYPSGRKNATFVVPDGIDVVCSVRDNPYLKSIYLPDSVTMFGDGVFSNSSSLESLYFENADGRLENIVDGCDALESVYCGGTAGYYSLTSKHTTMKLYLAQDDYYARKKEHCENIGFDYATVQETGTIKDYLHWFVTDDGSLVFMGIGEIPDYTADSAPWAKYRDSIKHIYLYEGVTVLGNYSFTQMPALETVWLSDGITKIKEHAFDSLSGVTVTCTQGTPQAEQVTGLGAKTMDKVKREDTDGVKGEDLYKTLANASDYDNYPAALEMDLICRGIDATMSDYEKVLYVYTYMAQHYSYDYEKFNAMINQENYDYAGYKGIFEEKVGVCDDYTFGFMAIMEQLNIPCKRVISFSMNHSWNAVELDGKWYQLDVTWASRGNGNVEYKYFLRSDEVFKNQLNHTGGSVDVSCDEDYERYFMGTYSDVTGVFYQNGGWYFAIGTQMYSYDFEKKSQQLIFEGGNVIPGYINNMGSWMDIQTNTDTSGEKTTHRYVYYPYVGLTNSSCYEIHRQDLDTGIIDTVFHVSRFSDKFISGFRLKSAISGGAPHVIVYIDDSQQEFKTYSQYDLLLNSTLPFSKMNDLYVNAINVGEYTINVLNDSECELVHGGASDDGSFIIPENIGGYKVVQVGHGAFEDWETTVGSTGETVKLTNVVIPASVVRLDSYAFKNCKNLKNVTINNPEISIGADAFAGTPYLNGDSEDDTKGDDNTGEDTTGGDSENPGKEKVGDVNGDDAINASDALLILQYVVEKTNLTDDQKVLADVNHDDLIDVSDALLILKYNVGLITEFQMQ